MKPKYLFILLSFCALLPLHAQQNEWRARELLDFVIAGQGDSVHVRLNDQIQQQLPPEMFSAALSQLEAQCGKYQSYGEWEEVSAHGILLYQCLVKFEKIRLYFLTAFDDDGRANTIRFVPTRTVPAAHIEMDKTKMEEHPIEVVCGEFKLPGTLTLPKGRTHVPVVIWVHGSGPNDRDETIGPNKPFRDLAWGMAERGIASIRYDKRTRVYGEKYAPGDKGTYDDETVDDVLAAIELAKHIKEINPAQIYVAGHSLGAMLAPRIVQRSEGLAGIIMIAGNARPVEELLPEQIIYLASLSESPELQKQVEDIIAEVDNLKKIGTEAFDENMPMPLGAPRPYWEFSLTYKQVEVAKKLTLPMLILQGERDYQVTMEDFNLWRSALSHKPNVLFKSYSTLNHLLQEGEGKSTPAEYSEEKRVPAFFIDDIAKWIKEKKV